MKRLRNLTERDSTRWVEAESTEGRVYVFVVNREPCNVPSIFLDANFFWTVEYLSSGDNELSMELEAFRTLEEAKKFGEFIAFTEGYL